MLRAVRRPIFVRPQSRGVFDVPPTSSESRMNKEERLTNQIMGFWRLRDVPALPLAEARLVRWADEAEIARLAIRQIREN